MNGFLIKPSHENFAHPALCTTLLINSPGVKHKDAQSETIFGTEAFLRTK